MVATGSMLFILGWGIDYSGIIALTVAFGIAVDDSVHFLARYHQERLRGLEALVSVKTAIRHIAPVITLTTLVLLAGILVTQLGQMPQTKIFGMLCGVTLIFALLADLIFLPATILSWEKFKTRNNADRGQNA